MSVDFSFPLQFGGPGNQLTVSGSPLVQDIPPLTSGEMPHHVYVSCNDSNGCVVAFGDDDLTGATAEGGVLVNYYISAIVNVHSMTKWGSQGTGTIMVAPLANELGGRH